MLLLLTQVEEIALLNTTLIKWDGSRVLYPNYKMNTDMIVNVTRSNNKGELFTVNVDLGTSLSVFEEIEKLIKLHSEPSPDINAIAVSPGNGGNPLKFTLVVWWEYSFNSESLSYLTSLVLASACVAVCASIKAHVFAAAFYQLSCVSQHMQLCRKMELPCSANEA